MEFGSLFAGIGGLDLGLERAGMTCKWQVENEPYAIRVLERHWPDVRRWDDVKTFPPDGDGERCNDASQRQTEMAEPSGRNQSSERWRVDLICGGFPCQDISYAGRGAGLDGERSGLFFEAIRVVRQLRPRYVLLENVAALLTRGLDRVHGELATIGYCSESHCIPAAAVGAPHVRDRVFVFGWDTNAMRCSGNGWKERQIQDTNTDPNRTSKDVADTDSGRFAGRVIKNTGRGEGGRIECNDWWATEPDICRVANGVPSRVDRLRGLGNSVVPQVAEWIGRKIMECNQK